MVAVETQSTCSRCPVRWEASGSSISAADKCSELWVAKRIEAGMVKSAGIEVTVYSEEEDIRDVSRPHRR
jgi:hypothetical protein